MIRKTFQGKRKVNSIEQIQMDIYHPLSSGELRSSPTFILEKYQCLIFGFKVILGHIKYIIFDHILDCIYVLARSAEDVYLSSNC